MLSFIRSNSNSKSNNKSSSHKKRRLPLSSLSTSQQHQPSSSDTNSADDNVNNLEKLQSLFFPALLLMFFLFMLLALVGNSIALSTVVVSRTTTQQQRQAYQQTAQDAGNYDAHIFQLMASVEEQQERKKQILKKRKEQKQSQAAANISAAATAVSIPLAPQPFYFHQEQNIVHVVVACGVKHFPGLQALVNSIYQNTKQPKLLYTHVFILDRELREMTQQQQQQQEDNANKGAFYRNTDSLPEWWQRQTQQTPTQESFPRNITIHSFTSKEVAPYLNPHVTADLGKDRLKADANYVRFILPKRFPDLSACLWVDTDVIVQGDVVEWVHKQQEAMTQKKKDKSYLLAAFPRRRNKGLLGVKKRAWEFLRRRGVNVAEALYPNFNAGVLLLDLKQWRAHNMDQTMQQICGYNQKMKSSQEGGRPLYNESGSQAPLLLALSGKRRFYPLDTNHDYLDGLGYDKYKTTTSPPFLNGTVHEIMFLHWNGDSKPWNKNVSNRLYPELWWPYSEQENRPLVL